MNDFDDLYIIKKYQVFSNGNTYMILDGLIHTNVYIRDESLQEILLNGRHYLINSIVTHQCPINIRPEIRCNFSYIFLFNQETKSDLKKIYRNYGGMFSSFEIFEKYFKEFTSEHGCMVIDNTKY